MRVPDTPGMDGTSIITEESHPNLAAAINVIAEQRRFSRDKIEDFKTEQEKDLDERARLSEMPRSKFDDPRQLNVWRREHRPSKGYYGEGEKGRALTTDDDEVLDTIPTARMLRGT